MSDLGGAVFTILCLFLHSYLPVEVIVELFLGFDWDYGVIFFNRERCVKPKQHEGRVGGLQQK